MCRCAVALLAPPALGMRRVVKCSSQACQLARRPGTARAARLDKSGQWTLRSMRLEQVGSRCSRRRRRRDRQRSSLTHLRARMHAAPAAGRTQARATPAARPEGPGQSLAEQKPAAPMLPASPQATLNAPTPGVDEPMAAAAVYERGPDYNDRDLRARPSPTTTSP